MPIPVQTYPNKYIYITIKLDRCTLIENAVIKRANDVILIFFFKISFDFEPLKSSTTFWEFRTFLRFPSSRMHIEWKGKGLSLEVIIDDTSALELYSSLVILLSYSVSRKKLSFKRTLSRHFLQTSFKSLDTQACFHRYPIPWKETTIRNFFQTFRMNLDPPSFEFFPARSFINPRDGNGI